MTQQYSSKNTSINSKKLPIIYSKINWDNLKKEARSYNILDYGAGKFTSHIKEYVEAQGFKYYAYDKYWESTKGWETCNPDLVICSNVLNVIQEDDIIKEMHEEIINLGPYMISIYEGDKSGIGKNTKSDCYQRNKITENYKADNEIVYKKVITKIEYKKYIK